MNGRMSLSITFYLYLSIRPVICVYVQKKKFINLNNLIAEIRKVKRIEKEIALTNSMKTSVFKKK